MNTIFRLLWRVHEAEPGERWMEGKFEKISSPLIFFHSVL